MSKKKIRNLTEADMDEIVRMYRAGILRKVICSEVGVCNATIGNVLRRRGVLPYRMRQKGRLYKTYVGVWVSEAMDRACRARASKMNIPKSRWIRILIEKALEESE